MFLNRTLSALALTAISAMATAQYQAVDLHPAGSIFSQINSATVDVQAGTNYFPSSGQHAARWSGTLLSFASLGDASWDNSGASGTDGIQIVGSVTDGASYAALWTISDPTPVNLHPGPQYEFSAAHAVSAGYQAGYAAYPDPLTGNYVVHGIVWNGTASSYVNVTPPGLMAIVYGIETSKLVGSTMQDLSSFQHATYWPTITSAPVDLNPVGIDHSYATGIGGAQQVGSVYSATTGEEHAALWYGTAGSFVDLNPVGCPRSIAQDTNGTQQAGAIFMDSTGGTRAAVWSGTAASVVNLHQFLQPDAISSWAYAIDSDGNVYGFAIYPNEDGSFSNHATMWRRVAIPPQFSNFLQPINDPAQPESTFKQGRTVPVKIRLRDAEGDPVTDAIVTISVVMLGASEEVVNEASYMTPADMGSLFRWTGDHYIYNLGTKGLIAGRRYRITASCDGAQHSVTISLR